MLLMATSPGGRGGQTVLDLAFNYFPFMGGDVSARFSLPSFYQNFDEAKGITDNALQAQLEEALTNFQAKIQDAIVQA